MPIRRRFSCRSEDGQRDTMVSEFDLPCTDCNQPLERAEVELSPEGGPLTVAECPTCGGRYYPESALDQV